MGYIYEDELKEILPGILDQWIDDEGDLEWIFQEIEQKCHIGKKGKKKKKFDKEEYIRRNRVDIDALIQKFQALNKEVEEMHRNQIESTKSMTILAHEISEIKNDVSAAKSMAQTAKDRTQVDYTKCTDGYFTEAQVAQHIYNRMANRGATREELDSFRHLIKKYDATNYQPPVKVPANDKFVYADGKTAEEVKEIIDCFKTKGCKTCKYYTDREAGHGMHNSELDCYSIVGPCVDYSKWEAKGNG